MLCHGCGLGNCKEKLPSTKSKLQERRQKFLIIWSTHSAGKKKVKQIVHLRFLLPLQPTGYLCKYFKVQLKKQKKKFVCEPLNSIFELYNIKDIMILPKQAYKFQVQNKLCM